MASASWRGEASARASCHQRSRPRRIATGAASPTRRTTSTAVTDGAPSSASSAFRLSGTTLPRRQAPSHVTSAFVREALARGAAAFDWTARKARSGQRRGPKVTGIGVAVSPFIGGYSIGYDGLLTIRPDRSRRDRWCHRPVARPCVSPFPATPESKDNNDP